MAAQYMGYSFALALALETSTARVSSALATCRADKDAWIFARPDGEPWHNDDYRNWRKRGLRAGRQGAGVKEPRPYDLRHSFVSLLINEGVSFVEVARQARHSPEECLRTYAHTFEEFDPADRHACADETRTETQEFGSQSQADGGIRTLDPRFTRAVLWPTELRRRSGGRV
jgi:hypothetical protein